MQAGHQHAAADQQAMVAQQATAPTPPEAIKKTDRIQQLNDLTALK